MLKLVFGLMKEVSLIPSSCPWSIHWRRWHIHKSASSLATIHMIWGLKVQEIIAVWFVRLRFSVQYGLKKPHTPVLSSHSHSFLPLCNDLPWKSKSILGSDCQARSGNQPRLKSNGQKAGNDQRSSSLFFPWMLFPRWGKGEMGWKWTNMGHRTAPFLKG